MAVYGKGKAKFALEYAEEKGALNAAVIEANEDMQQYEDDMGKVRLAAKGINFLLGGGGITEGIVNLGVEGIGEHFLAKNLKEDIEGLDALDSEGKKFSKSSREEIGGEIDTMVDTMRSSTWEQIGVDTYSAYKTAGGITPGDASRVSDEMSLTKGSVYEGHGGEYFNIGKDGVTEFYDSYWDYMWSGNAWRGSGMPWLADTLGGS